MLRRRGADEFDGQDDSVRRDADVDDEVGVVIQAFNAMLDRSSERNAELSRANHLKTNSSRRSARAARTPLAPSSAGRGVLRTTGAEGATRSAGSRHRAHARAQVAPRPKTSSRISRIVTGKLRIQVRPVDLAEIIDAAIEVVRPARPDADALTTEIAVRPAMTSGDPDRQQVRLEPDLDA